jgi:mannose-6-phosphate isomerase-like protein (cupin superfamily)
MKRVVTGHDHDGKSVFVSISEPPRTVTSQYGTQHTYCWGISGPRVVPTGGDDPTLTMSSIFPATDATSFFVVQFPGHHQGRIHTTDTVDYVTILSGELWLVLDNEAEVHLGPGDCVVQNGTQHAWHNRTPAPCVCVGVMVGAKHQG